jgi:hypothetical protein
MKVKAVKELKEVREITSRHPRNLKRPTNEQLQQHPLGQVLLRSTAIYLVPQNFGNTTKSRSKGEQDGRRPSF